MKKIRSSYSTFLIVFGIMLIVGTLPAGASISVSGQMTHLYQVRAGDIHEGQIDIVNSSDEPSQVDLYQTDYMFFADGSNCYDEPGTLVRSNANWISLRQNRVMVPPRSVVSVPFSIVVPEDDLSGSYWSMVMVERVSGPQITQEGELDTISTGIITKVRYGVQIICDVGQGHKSVEILSAGVEKDPEGVYYLYVEVENDGEVRLVPQMAVWVYDEHGELMDYYEGNRGSIVPESSMRYVTALEGLKGANYAVLATLDNGDGNVWGAQYDLELH